MSIKETLVKVGAELLTGSKEKAPEIALIGGVIAIVGGTILACKATLKLDEVLDKHESEMARIEEAEKAEDLPEYGVELAKADRTKVTVNTVIDTAKAYLPAAAVMTAGICLVLVSHKILRDRNTALMGAYSALATAYAAYRDRVISDRGYEADRYYLTGERPKLIEKKVKNEQTGKDEIVLVEDKGDEEEYPLGSQYARIFDHEHTPVAFDVEVDPHNDLNFTFLKQAQLTFNDKLQSEGHVYLNEVLSYLGYNPVPEGQLVGWLKDGSKDSDGYIDFGIYNCYTNPDLKKFYNTVFFEKGFVRPIVLDFNVDGVIFDKVNANEPKNGLTDEDLWALQNK